MAKKLSLELLEEMLSRKPIPSVKEISYGIYEFRHENFVVRGGRSLMEDVDVQLIKDIKNYGNANVLK